VNALYPVQNNFPDPYRIPPAQRIARLGKQTLYFSHTGFEAALADTDAERITDTYAEAIIDIWNPWAIAYEHLPFLAWATGVNLWEHWWSEEQQRSWVARQWYLKSIRGTRAGLDEFVSAVGGSVKRCVVPPARAYATARMTEAERIAYVARFPQLRIYPFVEREKLPWLCYNPGAHYDGLGQQRRWSHNGNFLGPRWKLYPTIQSQGGNYTRTAKLYEPRTGVETLLTIRKIVKIATGPSSAWGFTPGVSQYDESVVLPLEHRPNYFIGESGKYLGAHRGARGVFLGKKLKLRTISIGRSGFQELYQGKAQYQTIFPQEDLLQVRPEYVANRHQRRPTELYTGSSRRR
jgi:Phage tail protein (Tail_P2_I)